MTIDEAIKVLEPVYQGFIPSANPKSIEALKLSVEALKRCKYISEHTERWAGVLLPGETTG